VSVIPKGSLLTQVDEETQADMFRWKTAVRTEVVMYVLLLVFVVVRQLSLIKCNQKTSMS